jgi:membrane-bound lytic murein transglycosylase A
VTLQNHPRRCGFWLFLLLFASAAPSCGPAKQSAKPPVLERVSVQEAIRFAEDLNPASLHGALENSLVFYGRLPDNHYVTFGDWQVSAADLKDTLLHFSQLIAAHPEKLTNTEDLAQEFDIYRASGSPDSGKFLVTGYYEPLVQGRLQRDEIFRYPLYGMPSDLITADLGRFDAERFRDQRIVGRLEGNRLVPYFTRDEIDGRARLEHCGCQLVWLNDPIAAFFLHIQGSGLIALPDGTARHVGYAGSNGRPYRSIGRVLVEQGVITPDAVSLQTIRSYLESHPETLHDILCSNESYVFFRWEEQGPLGSLGVAVTANRSIATDHRYYPKGGLAFLISEKPILDSTGEVLGWEPLQRWVLNQDSGGAIRGPGRIDLFCGTGETAEWTAGRLKHDGTCYFLLKKGAVLKSSPP